MRTYGRLTLIGAKRFVKTHRTAKMEMCRIQLLLVRLV